MDTNFKEKPHTLSESCVNVQFTKSPNEKFRVQKFWKPKNVVNARPTATCWQSELPLTQFVVELYIKIFLKAQNLKQIGKHRLCKSVKSKCLIKKIIESELWQWISRRWRAKTVNPQSTHTHKDKIFIRKKTE